MARLETWEKAVKSSISQIKDLNWWLKNLTRGGLIMIFVLCIIGGPARWWRRLTGGGRGAGSRGWCRCSALAGFVARLAGAGLWPQPLGLGLLEGVKE